MMGVKIGLDFCRNIQEVSALNFYICITGSLSSNRAARDFKITTLVLDIMEGNFKTKQQNRSVNNSHKKTKGERLGWKSISEYRAVPIKDVIGSGNVVNETSSYMNTCVRLIP